MSVVKWIHFSDLHFNKTNINTRLLRDSIKSFLKEKNIKCDYAFFSGDLRNAPDKCFQKDSVKYLKELYFKCRYYKGWEKVWRKNISSDIG